MLNLILPLLLAFLGGVGGFFLRRWELAAIFEPSGLAVLWSTPSLLLMALCVVLAAAIILLCRRGKFTPAGYDDAFCAQNSWPYLVLMAFAAASMLFAGLLGLRAGGYCGILCKLMNFMCLLSFFCILVCAWGNFRGKTLKYSLALLAPGYTLCLWLVSAYQQRAADPVVLDYVYELLAIICTLLGLYFSIGFAFGRPKVRLCTVFSLLGICFSIITMADPHSMADRLLFLFSILYQLAHVTALLYHTHAAHTPAQSVETNHTQEVTPDE